MKENSTHLHKYLSAAMAVLLCICVSVNTAAGQEPDTTVIDRNKTGSLTILKQVEDDFLDSSPSMTQAEIAEYLQTHPDELKPLAGVEFRYKRVADVVQYSQDNTVTIGYSLDAAAEEFLDLDGTTSSATIDDVAIYDSAILDAALNRKTATETELFMSDADRMPVTDTAGKATVTDLELGLYLVCEYSYPGTAIADEEHCAPFFVSIPSTDLIPDGETYWNYDVTVAPKNMIDPIQCDLVIVDASGNETKEHDAEIGETVNFLARSDVPRAVGKLQTYQISVSFENGISVNNSSILVYGVSGNSERHLLVSGTDYNVSHNGNELNLRFVQENLADTEGWAVFDCIEIYYSAALNSAALIGSGNETELKTVYSKYTNSESDVVETVTQDVAANLFTYALDLHKIGSDTKAGLAGVQFQLKDAGGNVLKVKKLEDGIYCLDSDGTDTLATDQAGDLYIKGLGAGEYRLKETSTKSPLYNLLSGSVKIGIESNNCEYRPADGGNYAMVNQAATYFTAYHPDKNYFPLPLRFGTGELVPTGTYVRFATPSVMTEPDGQPVSCVEMVPLEWNCNYTMGQRGNSEDSGVVKIELTNSRIYAPKTGDYSIIYLPAIGLIAASVVCIILAAKTKKVRK